MQSAKLKNYLHLHFIVFIWGFTAVLGKLITIGALPLVWYRMLMATVIILFFVLFKKYPLRISTKLFLLLILAGVIIALHWVTFFMAIKVSNVFFTALLEPIWYGRKMIWYEIVFGVVVMLGLYLIFSVETSYVKGILLALISAFLVAIFSLINGKLAKQLNPAVISFYELGSGVVFLSLYLLVSDGFSSVFFQLSVSDIVFIFILASICTAYAFIASVKIMRYLSPYTVMLTINLEPIYGILLAFVFIGETEKMNPLFYVGALLILSTVVANGILKNKMQLKK